MLTEQNYFDMFIAGIAFEHHGTPAEVANFQRARERYAKCEKYWEDHPDAPDFPSDDLEAALGEVLSEYWTTNAKLDAIEWQFKLLIPQTNIDSLNKQLKAMSKRGITHRDIAFIWEAFKHNVIKNEDSSSPVDGIIGLSKSAISSKMISAAPDYAHLKFVIKWFQTLNLAKIIGEPSKGQATRYELLPNQHQL